MALPINTASLLNELRRNMIEIDKQIVAIKRDVANQVPVHIEPDPDLAYRMKNKDGTFVLAPLLIAKSQCLSAIASLQAGERR